MFRIQTHPFGDYITGVDLTGHQLIVGLIYPFLSAVVFGADGSVLEVRFRRLSRDAARNPKSGAELIEDAHYQEYVNSEIGKWSAELEIMERPISVESFSFRELSIGVEQLPRHFLEFRRDPDSFTDEERREFPKLIEDWQHAGSFVLLWGHDYYLEKSGEIL